MTHQDKNTRLEHIRGRYGIIIALIAAISGSISIPYLCHKKSPAEPATKQKIEIATNQNSPVAGEIGTQNNYYNSTEKDTAKKSRLSSNATPSIKKKPVAGIYAPNANIVTQNQTGGTNTVVIADSYERKLEALKNTAPNVSYRLYIRDSFLMVDVELKNNVPIEFSARMRTHEGIPTSNLYFSPETLYPERQKKYTFKVEKLYPPGFHDPSPVFKGIITVNMQSIYYDEIQERRLWKRSHRMYLFDKINQTLTPTNDPTSDVVYRDTSRIPWENIDH